MADKSTLADLLERARQILKLVCELADGIRENEGSPGDENQRRVAFAWKALLPAIIKAGESLPSEPNPVADWIREVGRVSQWFDDAVRQHGLADVLFQFNCDGFIRVADKGRALFKNLAAESDSFAFVDVPRRTTLQPPADWDGTLDNWPGAKARGFLVDEIGLGPTAAWGNTFPISSFDCIPVEGSVPTICPNADRKPQAEWLPGIERRFRDLNLVKKGQTIHWVGSQSKPGKVCGCFHPDRNLPETRDDAAAGKLAADTKTDAGNGQSAEPASDSKHAEDVSGTKVRQPSDDACTCYRVYLLTGMKQVPLAERLSEELGRPIAQGQVSRWIADVEKWIAAGNILPDFPQPMRRKPDSMDPQKLDIGERQDHLTQRQRKRRSDDSDDSDD